MNKLAPSFSETIRRQPAASARRLPGQRALTSLAVAGLMLGLGGGAQAQTVERENAVYDGFLRAFVLKDGDKTYVHSMPGSTRETFMWYEAYVTTGLADAFEANPTPERAQLVGDIMSHFTIHNHLDLKWDSWNDDVAWAIIGYTRSYQVSGRKNLLEAAELNFNMAYDRGWDTEYFGGGIWEHQGKIPGGGKCALSNFPFVTAATQLYLATGNKTYLNKARKIYDWAADNLLDRKTGKVGEVIKPSGTVMNDNIYNGGMALNAANALWKLTGDRQYYNDALLIAERITNKTEVVNSKHNEDSFFRGLANFARQNNLWSKYGPWLKANADSAWKNRRTDYNITTNHFAEQTTRDNEITAMDANSSLMIQSVIRASEAVVNLKGNYQIKSVASGLSLGLPGSTKTKGTPVEQLPYSGDESSLWHFDSVGGGYYRITNVHSGQVLNVAEKSGLPGAAVIQYPADDGYTAGNDLWRIYKHKDGSFGFINQLSLQGLDIKGGVKTAGQDLQQWFVNGSEAQKFTLVSAAGGNNPKGPSNDKHTVSPAHAPGSALDNYEGHLAAGNKIEIWAKNTSSAQKWVFSNAGVSPAGYYNISVLNGNYCLTATGGSGADTQLQKCSGTSSQAWRTVPSGTGYALSPASNTGVCLDVRAAKTDNGTVVQTFTCNSSDAQEWLVD